MTMMVVTVMLVQLQQQPQHQVAQILVMTVYTISQTMVLSAVILHGMSLALTVLL